jgi:hypothetical protein
VLGYETQEGHVNAASEWARVGKFGIAFGMNGHLNGPIVTSA